MTQFVFFLATCVCLASGAQSVPGRVIVDDSPQARRIFHMADLDGDALLMYGEFQHLFRDFDGNGDGNITSTEWLEHWQAEQLGPVEQGLKLFLNLDISKTMVINISHDMPYIFTWFDINDDMHVTEGEFVIQWVKISS